jgi:hypothetical protein
MTALAIGAIAAAALSGRLKTMATLPVYRQLTSPIEA